jgi:uncharacterized protein
VVDDAGRVAVQRGPIIYCLEGLDQPTGIVLSDVALELSRRPEADFHAELKKDLLDGVVVLHHEGVVFERESANVLYPRFSGESPKTDKIDLTFIPYYAWSNREATGMQVWTPVLRA